MKKRFMMFTLLATAFSGMVHADDAAIRQSLAKLGGAEHRDSTCSGCGHENRTDQ